MINTISAGFVNFAIGLGTGFVLGVFRVSFLVFCIGERWAELVEMPIMAAAIFFSGGCVLRRFREVNFPGQSLVVGFLALALTVCAELGLAVVLQTQTLVEYLVSRDKVSGSVYLVMRIVFALMPRIQLPNPK
jgi:hypothetical protein